MIFPRILVIYLSPFYKREFTMRKMLLLIWIGISCFANDIKEINGVMSLIKADTVEIPQSPEVKVIQGVPAYIWSYGCFPTAAAMMLGYWDNHGFPNIYTGPTNDGNMPITNNG